MAQIRLPYVVICLLPSRRYTLAMPTITVNDRRVYYTHQSAENGRPALVLIHGAGGSHADWPPALRERAETAVYALDLPAHGRSDPPAHKSVDGYANFVQAWMQALNLQRVVLVGHSMGGAIAQTLGLRRLTAVVGLILIGTSARLRVTPTILNNLPHQPTPAIDFIQQYAWSPTAPADVKATARQRLVNADPAVLLADYRACNQFDLVGQLSPIDVPTLVISGSEDKMTPAKYGRLLADEIPTSRFVEIGGAGHYIMQEAPAAVATTVQQFLHTFR